jgi:hypothetical protein
LNELGDALLAEQVLALRRLGDQLARPNHPPSRGHRSNEAVRAACSRCDPVEPAAQAHQRTSGPEDIPNPIQQP